MFPSNKFQEYMKGKFKNYYVIPALTNRKGENNDPQ